MEPTTFYLRSLGCPKNRVDSEVILGALMNGGHKPVEDPLEARLIVVNTCSFIESATQESIDTILELAQAKQRGQCKFFVVAGCLPQRYGRTLANSMPEVDLLLEGRLASQAPEVDGCVFINKGFGQVGEIMHVRITEAHPYDLVGEVVGNGNDYPPGISG